MVTPPPGHGRLRASHADREQVVDVLKAAYIQGRLAQRRADRAGGPGARGADLCRPGRTHRRPARRAGPSSRVRRVPDGGPAPRSRYPHGRGTEPVNGAVTAGAAAIAATMVAAAAAAVIAGEPAAALILAVVIVVLAAVATAFVASLIAVAVGLESRHRNRSRRLPAAAARAWADPTPLPPPRAPGRA